jgi:predicted transposase YbfD/YdcC
MTIEDLRDSFEDFSSGIPEHRVDRNKLHSISEILFLTLTAIICGCEGWRDIERFGRAKIEVLRRVFPFKYGIPSDDTLRRFFRSLNPVIFQTCFVEWVKTLKLPSSLHVAIDGKISRHSFDGENNPLHIVSAFSSEYRLVLAQEKVSDKSNEITAIPKLLSLLDLQGAVITIDAMGCQREIAEQIGQKEADYVFSLKGNQGSLNQDVTLMFQDADVIKSLKCELYETVDGSEHGRLEERQYRVIQCPDSIQEHHNWPHLKTLIEVTSMREIKGDRTQEKRYYISSLGLNAKKIGDLIRAHWSVENSLHWVLDISFRDDDSRIRRGNAPQNIAVIKHMALNLLQKTKGKRDSIKQLRKAAGWDNDLLFNILQKI